ncbi:MAG: zinc transporter ZupT [Pseudomonadota bacterium]
MYTDAVFIAFAMTMIAGLSTGFGSLLALLVKRTNTKLLSAVLGFSAGVMIYVSFVDLLSQANLMLVEVMGKRPGSWATVAAFFGGILLIAVIDKLIPSFENPHEMRRLEEMDGDSCQIHSATNSLMKMGMLTAVAIAVHNFPEGIATFVAALHDPHLGIAITLAIAIHNIPEGIAVSVPIFCATGSKQKAFVYSLLSGLSEPVGALLGYLFLLPILSDQVFGILFALVAGIMVFISLDELLPTAREYGEPHIATYGLVAGMAVMAISLLLFIQ